MNETEKQLTFYFFEIISSILIGSFVALSYNDWQGLFAGGIVLFVSMILNSLFFGKNFALESVVVFGFISLVSISLGVFHTFGPLFAITSVIGILIVIFILIFFAKKP